MVVAFDVETHLIQPGLLAPPLVCGSFAHHAPNGELLAIVLDAEDTAKELVANIECGDHIVGANIAYDMAVMLAYDFSLAPLIFEAYEKGLVHDVSIRQALNAIAEGHLYMDPNGGPLRDNNGKVVNRYSLATCLRLTTGRVLEKADTFRTRYAELDGVPLSEWPKEAIEYSKNDAIATLEVYNAQEAAGYKNLQDEAAQCRTAFALHLSSVRGLRTDAAKVGAISEHVTAQFKEDIKKFQAAGFIRSDGSCDKTALSALVTKAYLNAPPMTAGGKVRGPVISTSRETLENSGDETLEAYAAAGANKTLHNTFVPVLELGTVVGINPTTNVLVVTGRTSYGKPNLQNLPRAGGVRPCICARPGFLLASVDIAAAELIAHAQNCYDLFGYSQLREVINAGQDPHSDIGSALTGKTYDEFRAGLKAGEKWADTARQASKAASFGFPGGAGAPAFVSAKRKEGMKICLIMGRATECGIEKLTYWGKRDIDPTCKACLEATQELRKMWLEKLPEMPLYFDYISRLTSDGPASITQLPTGRVRANCTYTEACNTLFQGRSADAAKHALWMITKECYTDKDSALWGSRPVIFVHDEIVIELVESRATEALHAMEKTMIAALQVFTPDVKVAVEGAVTKFWYKGAKPLYVDGKIVPVKPGPEGKGWVHDAN